MCIQQLYLSLLSNLCPFPVVKFNLRMSLRRETIFWLQSMDLSYSIRNPTRDFSNGCLIAEILHRYYGSEMQLHSVGTGLSSVVKEDNWRMITGILSRKNVHFDPALVTDCIHQRNGAAFVIINKLHEHFEPTKSFCGRDTPVVAMSTCTKSPHYAKETASFKVKDSNIERTRDDMERKLKRVQVICDLAKQNRSPTVSCNPAIIPITNMNSLDSIFHRSQSLVEVNSLNELFMHAYLYTLKIICSIIST